jgi:CRP-like cAMP-binding protein
VLTVIVDGEALGEIGPGAILGERAVLEGGTRTSTLEASTPCRVAVARAEQIDRAALLQLAEGHRQEPESRRRAREAANADNTDDGDEGPNPGS